MGFGGLAKRERPVQCRLNPACSNLFQTPLQIFRIGEDGAPKLLLREKEITHIDRRLRAVCKPIRHNEPEPANRLDC